MSDALNRRRRFGERNPLREPLPIAPRDIQIFEALERHGWLPTPYIHALVGGNAHNLGVRLTTRYHDGYLYRPAQQRDAFNARYQAITHALDVKGQKALGTKANKYAHPPGGWALHQYMTSCITASIEIACRKQGFIFISQEMILGSARCQQRTLELSARQTKLFPDQLFGICYGPTFDAPSRFFALEADRATEDRERFDIKTSLYHDVFRTQEYYHAWGIPKDKFKCLIVTTSPERIDRIIEATDKNFLFQAYAAFQHWSVPPVLATLIESPWRSKDGTFEISRP